MKKYKIIYADPPWSYNDKCKSGNRGAGFKYPCSNIDELKALPVSQMADKNAVLVMWVTWPMLPEALSLISAWGFKYKSCGFVWIKRNKCYWQNLAKSLRKLFKLTSKPQELNDAKVKAALTEREFLMGMGAAGTRANTEFCIIAKRGSVPRLHAGMSQIFEADIDFESQDDPDAEVFVLPHTGRNSEKPAEIRDRIVALYGDLPRVELFSRHQPEGWDVWGNEADITYNVNMEAYDERIV